MKLVKNYSVNVKAVLVGDIGRQRFILTAGGDKFHFLLACFDVHFLFKLRLPFYHLQSDVKNDLCLVPVSGASVHLSARFKIRAEQIQCDRCSEFGLALLFRNFNIRRIELTIAVGLQYAEDISDDLFLPVYKLERFAVPCSFGVTAEPFYKANGVVGGVLIIVAVLRHEPRRFVFL